MNATRLYSALIILTCSILLASANGGLSSIWSDPASTVNQRTDAVNQAFTNGTPVSVVVTALGTNYMRAFSSARVWLGPGPEPRNTSWLVYSFGDETVDIHTTASISEDPLLGRFTGAGYSKPVRNSTEFVQIASVESRLAQHVTEILKQAGIQSMILGAESSLVLVSPSAKSRAISLLLDDSTKLKYSIKFL
jgi:hypothetical protein